MDRRVGPNYKLTDLAYRFEVELMGKNVSIHRSLAAALPVAGDRDGSLGEPFHVRVVLLDHQVAKCRRYDQVEQSRMCDV